MPWSVAAAVGGAVVSSALAPSPSSSGASQADPFASQRGQYQTMLQNLIANPDSVTQSAMYKTQMAQGTAAVNQGEAASGYLNSGNRGTALQNEGENLATTDYNNQLTELNLLSGANVGSPGTAGQLTGAQSAQQTQAAGAVGNAVAGAIPNAGQAAYNYFNQAAASTPTSAQPEAFDASSWDYTG